MNWNISRLLKGRGHAGYGVRYAAFSTVEVLITVGMTAVLIALAVPSYRDAVEKRRITQGAELIVAFINTVQSESIKRNRPVAVSYASGMDGDWCIGAVVGTTACDCTEADPVAPGYCEIAGASWVLRSADVQAENLIQAANGDGAFVYDPVRGLFVDPTDFLLLDLGSEDGEYRMNLSVISTGKVSVCQSEVGKGIHGVKPCPEALLASD